MGIIRLENVRGRALEEDHRAAPRLRNEASVVLWAVRSGLVPLLRESKLAEALSEGDKDALECAELHLFVALEVWMRRNGPQSPQPSWLERHASTIKGHLADPMSKWTEVVSPIAADYPMVRPELLWHIMHFAVENGWHESVDRDFWRRLREFRAKHPCPRAWDYQVHLHVTSGFQCRAVSYQKLDPYNHGHLVVVDFEEEF